jgi:hypothetical protein
LLPAKHRGIDDRGHDETFHPAVCRVMDAAAEEGLVLEDSFNNMLVQMRKAQISSKGTLLGHFHKRVTEARTQGLLARHEKTLAFLIWLCHAELPINAVRKKTFIPAMHKLSWQPPSVNEFRNMVPATAAVVHKIRLEQRDSCTFPTTSTRLMGRSKSC